MQLIKIFHALGKEKWVFACLILKGIELCLLLLLDFSCFVLFPIWFLVVGVRNASGRWLISQVLLHVS